ncbi:MCE family protein [Umezawaea beigongshangensis]|uniref:MCE family protein n=1 Tax=Umezawaea beigongshangensis TaxID=2780383 RepID=UPI0018F18430|nr:MCE family protein [Umezawaea beigongshangensis]
MRPPVLLALALLLSGCSVPTAHDLPLPGGADLGDRPLRVVVEFDDVLDLVPQAAVKVADVPVGRVEDVALSEDGSVAEVTVLINGSVSLPADALARLRQSSLLGEKYVELLAPEDGEGALTDGARVPLARTGRNPEVEEVLGALSLLLNGGGIAQIRDISRELNRATGGREPQIRSLLEQLDVLSTGLDGHRDEITRALDGLDRLAGTLDGERDRIGHVLDDLEPGLRVLEQQRGDLVALLTSLDTLSDVAVDVVRRSRDDLVADLEALAPVLQQLAAAGEDLPRSLELLFTYPFTDAVLDGIRGDYLNTHVTLNPRTGGG